MKRLTRNHVITQQDRWDDYLSPNSALRRPAIKVDVGEKLIVETQNDPNGITHNENDANPAELVGRAETGPIYIHGVQAGDVVAMHIHQLQPVGHAIGTYGQRERNEFLRIDGGQVHFPEGLWAPVHMMLGEFYIAPNEQLKGNPWDNGGNMDFRDICAGNSLLFRAQVDGGLVVFGDAHACQGDGEVAGVGAECAAEAIVSFEKCGPVPISRPTILKPDGFVSIACRQDYAEARDIATDDAVKLFCWMYETSTDTARLYCAMVGHLRNGAVWGMVRRGEAPLWNDGITQVVGLDVPLHKQPLNKPVNRTPQTEIPG